MTMCARSDCATAASWERGGGSRSVTAAVVDVLNWNDVRFQSKLDGDERGEAWTNCIVFFFIFAIQAVISYCLLNLCLIIYYVVQS